MLRLRRRVWGFVLLGRGEGERGTQKEEGKGERTRRGEGGGVHTAEKKQKNNPAPPNYYTVAPAGKPPAGAPGGPPEGRGAALQWPHTKIWGHRRAGGEGGELAKNRFCVFQTHHFGIMVQSH